MSSKPRNGLVVNRGAIENAADEAALKVGRPGFC